MGSYTDKPESGNPGESTSVETRATKPGCNDAKRAPIRDVFSRRDLKGHREGTDDVVYRGRRRVRRVVPDATDPTMWRVTYPDGELGDRKNLSWARDEGTRFALSLPSQRTAAGRS